MTSPAQLLAKARASVESRLLSYVLGRRQNDRLSQERVFQRLLKGFSLCEYGRIQHLRPGMSYADFRACAPLQTRQSLIPLMEQARNGAADLLWPGRPLAFATFPALLGQEACLLPVTPEQLRHLHDAWRRALLLLCRRGSSAEVVNLPLIRTESPGAQASPQQALSGNLVLDSWQLLCLAVVQGSPRSVSRPPMAVPTNPSGLLVLDAHQPGALPSLLTQKAVSQAILIGPPYGIHIDRLRHETRRRLLLHEVFLCEAGIVAAQDGEFGEGLRLFTDQDIFLEFLPLRDCNEERIAECGSRVVPLADVDPGCDYILVASTPAGLCRFVTREVVRFLSTKPFRIEHRGRLETTLRGLGEWLDEQTLAESLARICSQQHWASSHFHVAPVISSSLTGQMRGHHEWWVELRPGTRQTPTGPVLGGLLDAALQDASRSYADRRKAGVLGAPVVRLLMPGIFDQWFAQNGLNPEHTRIPFSLPDRRIADALSKLARFYD